MMNLEVYFANLILRELEQFRVSAPTPAEDNATEVAQPNPPPLFATGQHPTAAQTADTNSAIDDDDEENKQQALASEPRDITALVDADEAANGFQGTPVRLITLRDATDRQRKRNGARRQRIYRLAHKIGVAPGTRWIRNGRPHMQPAAPRSVVRADGTVEYNQFMYDGVTGEVELRMPGGWRRGLVRTRPRFLGVAVVDGFLWPRFDRSLPRRMTVDWEEQGFVEFNEVRYTTRFIAREPKSASSAGSDEEDGILIKLDE
ncbi:hypothetical protein LA080_013100 [Diaporthe eres]|uniref:Uncharacterized protein n=1 Tax=Diaporthe vaccinii TaxID=105482 RepID=A0ABR4EAH3_9PEZI|nr:hypothetical protein LA080_013100 [Diaporthe eres]